MAAMEVRKICKLPHAHSSHPDFTVIFQKLQSRTGLRNTGEKPGKPLEVHECITMLWGIRKKLLPKSIELRADNPCENRFIENWNRQCKSAV